MTTPLSANQRQTKTSTQNTPSVMWHLLTNEVCLFGHAVAKSPSNVWH